MNFIKCSKSQTQYIIQIVLTLTSYIHMSPARVPNNQRRNNILGLTILARIFGLTLLMVLD